MKPNNNHKIKPESICDHCIKADGLYYSYHCFAQSEKNYDEPCNKLDQLVCSTAKALEK